MAAHNEMGRWGEDQAVAYLEQQGYTILERDWHSGHRDIDIIALHGRHAELRNVVEKSELKKNKDLKTKRREPDVSRALVFLLYILFFPQIFVRVPVSVQRPTSNNITRIDK